MMYYPSWSYTLGLLLVLIASVFAREVNFDDIFTDEPITQDPIPKIAHLVVSKMRDLQWIEYAAIKSAVVTLGAELVNIWVPPNSTFPGPIWEQVMQLPEIVIREVEMPTKIYGHDVRVLAHQSDIVRLEAVYKEGGIYLDYNAIALRSMDEIINNPNTKSTVMAHSVWGRLGNAWFMAKPHAPFLKRWMQGYKSFDDSLWAQSSTQLPGLLSTQYPSDITVLSLHAWFWPECCSNSSTNKLWFGKSFTDIDENFGVHQWNSGEISTALLTPEAVREIDTPFFCRIRHLFDRIGDDYEAVDWRVNRNCSFVSAQNLTEHNSGLMSSYDFEDDSTTKIVDGSGNRLHGWAPYGTGLLQDGNSIVREFRQDTFAVLPIPIDYDARVGTLSTDVMFQMGHSKDDIRKTLAQFRLEDDTHIFFCFNHNSSTMTTWAEIRWTAKAKKGDQTLLVSSDTSIPINDNGYHAFSFAWDRRKLGLITIHVDNTEALRANVSLLQETRIGQELWLNGFSQMEIDMGLRARLRYLHVYVVPLLDGGSSAVVTSARIAGVDVVSKLGFNSAGALAVWVAILVAMFGAMLAYYADVRWTHGHERYTVLLESGKNRLTALGLCWTVLREDVSCRLRKVDPPDDEARLMRPDVEA